MAASFLDLDTENGTVRRRVSTKPARKANLDEIPLIDVGRINSSDANDRLALAAEVKNAAENTGFFYIKNTGIDPDIIEDAYNQALRFFRQSALIKEKASTTQFSGFLGYSARASTHSNKSEPIDFKEQFAWTYDPALDPSLDASEVLTSDTHDIRHHENERLWTAVEDLSGFKDASIRYWQACLTLARSLTRIFAIALSLQQDTFDSIVTRPTADTTYNFYPSVSEDGGNTANDMIGLGSHTDITCFTLLYQDSVGGLVILNRQGEWIEATPIPGTFVVNIADFFSRMTNDRWQSTVHRVDINRSDRPRISMPFFFGFNADHKCAVLESCVSPDRPARYEPISCGEYLTRRMSKYHSPVLPADS